MLAFWRQFAERTESSSSSTVRRRFSLNSSSTCSTACGSGSADSLKLMKTESWSFTIFAANATASSFVFDPEFLCYAWRFVGNGGHKPSSGLVGIILAVKLCKTVSVYGFQSQNYFSQTSRPHYYDWERPAKGREKVHPFQREYKLYEMLEASGRIRRVQAPRAAGEATR